MKLLLSVILLLSLHERPILAQFSTFNDGAYRTHNDFFNNKPLYKSDFTFTLKYNKKIPELYSVKSANPRIKMKIVSKACLILENDQKLLKEFKNEPDKQSFEVLLNYLDLINSKSEPFPYRTKTNSPSPDNPSLKK